MQGDGQEAGWPAGRNCPLAGGRRRHWRQQSREGCPHRHVALPLEVLHCQDEVDHLGMAGRYSMDCGGRHSRAAQQGGVKELSKTTPEPLETRAGRRKFRCCPTALPAGHGSRAGQPGARWESVEEELRGRPGVYGNTGGAAQRSLRSLLIPWQCLPGRAPRRAQRAARRRQGDAPSGAAWRRPRRPRPACRPAQRSAASPGGTSTCGWEQRQGTVARLEGRQSVQPGRPERVREGQAGWCCAAHLSTGVPAERTRQVGTLWRRDGVGAWRRVGRGGTTQSVGRHRGPGRLHSLREGGLLGRPVGGVEADDVGDDGGVGQSWDRGEVPAAPRCRAQTPRPSCARCRPRRAAQKALPRAAVRPRTRRRRWGPWPPGCGHQASASPGGPPPPRQHPHPHNTRTHAHTQANTQPLSSPWGTWNCAPSLCASEWHTPRKALPKAMPAERGAAQPGGPRETGWPGAWPVRGRSCPGAMLSMPKRQAWHMPAMVAALCTSSRAS